MKCHLSYLTFTYKLIYLFFLNVEDIRRKEQNSASVDEILIFCFRNYDKVIRLNFQHSSRCYVESQPILMLYSVDFKIYKKTFDSYHNF